MLQATREAILNYIGNRTDDDSISLMETVDNEGVETENWKERYDQLDADWRKRYTDRFKEGTGSPKPEPTPIPKELEPTPEELEEERVEALNLNDILYGKEGE